MSTLSLIKDEYVAVVESIAKLEGVSGSGGATWRVPESVSRAQCLEYALQYVVRHSQLHYRYNQYREALNRVPQRLILLMKAECDRPLIHIDFGCGPGLFTWVVADFFRDYPKPLELFAYDHAPEMVSLATDIWEHLPKSSNCHWLDSLDKLHARSKASGLPYRGPLVTFGHVLAQTSNSEETIKRFAEAILDFDADEAVIVAQDAKSATRAFEKGRNSLETCFLQMNSVVDVVHRGSSTYIAKVRTRRPGTHATT